MLKVVILGKKYLKNGSQETPLSTQLWNLICNVPVEIDLAWNY